ncbi:MAG: hypothetical protein IJ599_02440, partial [Alphaproteobacteria bacterium]|nr:hypothetical protein [Alphaproteobacteria bacterium]
SGTLSGTIRDVAVTGEGCLHIGRYDAVRTGKYSADGGTIYTSDMKKLEQDITDLEKEQVMFANFSKSTRVTPEEALRRYQLIKDGKVSQLYDPQTLSNLQKDAGDHWMEVAAMDLYGLKGGGKFWKNFGKALGLVASVAVPFVAPVLAPVAAVGMAVSMSAIDGRSHSVGIATDGHNVAVGVDGGASHVLHQKQAAEQKHNQMLEGAQVPAPLKKLKSTYDLAVEGMPERIRLAQEIRSLFKPVDCYHPKYHKFRPDPLTQISNAYNRKVDSAEYWRNRTYYSRLYQSLCDAKIAQGDIQTIWGSPYIETVKRWDTLPEHRKSSLLKEYPEMADVSTFLTQTKREFREMYPAYDKRSHEERWFADEGIEDVSLWFLPSFPTKWASSLKVVFEACKAKAPQIVEKFSPKPEFTRDFVNFFKKKFGNEKGGKLGEKLEKKPRIQATRTDADKYLQGLKDKDVLSKKGVTKDGYEFYRFVKKCEYRGIKFKKDEYISRDTLHHEWEYFRNPKDHSGAIDPIKGDIYKDPVQGRILRLP